MPEAGRGWRLPMVPVNDDFDILLLDGDLLDGTGSPARPADVGVRGGRIAAVGALAAAQAPVRLDCAGRIVCPGFIDAHSHSDAYVLVQPDAPSKITQGVTTEVVGNCGQSAAPLLGRRKPPSDWDNLPYPGRWQTMAGYCALAGQVRPAVNLVPLVGHGALRACTMGYDGRPASPDELASMCRLLEESMAEGGRGVSAGLIYAPGLFAERSELVALGAVAARRGGVFTFHMRSESDALLDAIREVIAVAREAGIRVQISHLKTSRRENWGLIDRALELVESARAGGVCVAADRYPYTASCTDLDIVLPAWAREGGAERVMARLRDPAACSRMRTEMEARTDAAWWGSVLVASTRADANRPFRGRRMNEVADALGMSPAAAAIEVVRRDELATTAFFFGMSEENMWRILAQPWTMVGSDAALRAPEGPLSLDVPHPRAYGTFPRVLRASLDGRAAALPEAVRRMTSLPADHFGLSGRGRVAPGMAADLVVFDPARVRDLATYESPHRFSEGIEHVAVNGVLTLRAGRPTGGRGGRVLEG